VGLLYLLKSYDPVTKASSWKAGKGGRPTEGEYHNSLRRHGSGMAKIAKAAWERDGALHGLELTWAVLLTSRQLKATVRGHRWPNRLCEVGELMLMALMCSSLDEIPGCSMYGDAGTRSLEGGNAANSHCQFRYLTASC
jgi:hypothetical protein